MKQRKNFLISKWSKQDVKLWVIFSKSELWKGIYICIKAILELQGLLYNVTNNLNQITKRVNQTGIIYKNDIEDIKKYIDNFLKE